MKLADHVAGIKANEETIRAHLDRSFVLATLLSPAIGYEAAAELVKQAEKENRGITELVLERKLLTKEELDRIMRPEILASPGIVDLKGNKNGV